jgi:methyl-accepting chemotaxis protein
MADLVVLSDLKAKFSQFDEIAQIVNKLKHNLTDINTANRNAAGRDDTVAGAYHGQVDQPTNGLMDLVASIETMFGITGDNGKEVADAFYNAENLAHHTAQGW